MSRLLSGSVLMIAGLSSCRGEPPRSAAELNELVARLVPQVEEAAGLKFKEMPRVAMRSREQVRAYLINKLEESLPPKRMAGLETAYKLFGLLPDSIELRPLLLDVLSEQVAGFYEPDSSMFFGVEGSDTNIVMLKSILAHEMVHALQHQYLPLDSVVEQQGNNDRATAAQSVLEGQAMVVMTRVMAPQQDLVNTPGLWELAREQLRQQQSVMPAFAHAPRIIQETLISPYLDGAEFMRWWASSTFHDTMPYGRLMPVSTEQILHPFRYGKGDMPIAIHFRDSAAVLHEDVLGELEIHILDAELARAQTVSTAVPIGWGGDRYRVYDSPAGPALVWYTVWDDSAAATQFLAGTGERLARTGRPGYRAELALLDLDGQPAVRYVLAPDSWKGWKKVPEAVVAVSGTQ